MGFAVTREYYINDHGAQVDVLARSVHHRYLARRSAALRRSRPQGWYPAEELIAVAEAIARSDGDRWLEAAEAEWLPVFRSRGVAAMLELIRADLAALGVRHDVFTSEAALAADGRIEEALAELERQGLVYEGVLPPPKGQLERRLGAATAAAVPLDRVRRRRRPAAQAGGRRVDLHGRRSRVPPRQDPARRRGADRRLGRRSRRLCQAHAGRRARARRRTA